MELLNQRVREAPFIGTIDSILRDVLSEIAHDIGFEEMPIVGNTARQKQLHASCYRALHNDTDLARRLQRLEDAYPDAEYDDGVSEILEAAVAHCRDRRISTEEFRVALGETFEDVYAEGRPESFDDVVAAVDRYVGTDVDARIYDKIDDDERDDLFTFFREEVLNDLIASDLWSRIQQAENVTVEKPIDGLVTIDDVEIEIHGTCDFVVEMPSGERYVDDVKITLTDQTLETQRRYELQVTTYSYIFEQQKHSTNSVNRAVETFGVERETVESSWPSEIVERRLAALVR